MRNGDRVNIITSKNQSPSLHWIPTTKTGKARAAIRRYWHDKGEQKEEKAKTVLNDLIKKDKKIRIAREILNIISTNINS